MGSSPVRPTLEPLVSHFAARHPDLYLTPLVLSRVQVMIRVSEVLSDQLSLVCRISIVIRVVSVNSSDSGRNRRKG
jgi:hypothetical protein